MYFYNEEKWGKSICCAEKYIWFMRNYVTSSWIEREPSTKMLKTPSIWLFLFFVKTHSWVVTVKKKPHKHWVCEVYKFHAIIFLRIWNPWFHWYKYIFCYLCVTYKGIFLKLLATFISITFLSYFYQFIILYFIFLCLKASSPPSKISQTCSLIPFW